MRHLGVAALVAALLAVPTAAMAGCVFAVSAGSSGDLLNFVNPSSSDSLTIVIRDDAGALVGSSVVIPTIPFLGLVTLKVGDLYTQAGVPTSEIKATWIEATEGSGGDMVLQVKTAGGSMQVFQVDTTGGSSCH